MSRNTAAEKEWKKVSSQPMFNLYQSTTESHLWQIRLTASGGYLRRRLHAPSLASALEQAPRVAGLVGMPTAKDRLVSIEEAFTMALRASSRGEMSTRDWNRSVVKFLQWLQKQHPLCRHWGLVDRRILREFIACYAENSANHRRLMTQPVLQTAGFMHREHGFPNIGERLGVGRKLQTLPPPVYLEDVLSFCDWLRDNRPHLEAGACLQGLAGLQLLETLRLTWNNVDLDRGLVEITGEVKNEYRVRVIPVTKRVLEALERAKALQGVSGSGQGACVVVATNGGAYGHFRAYSKAVREALRRWKPGCKWAPKDLRNCLPTFAAVNGLQGAMWEQYIGHAPRTVTERHYVPRLAPCMKGEGTALDRQMTLLREKVVAPLEEAVSKTCKVLQVPGQPPQENTGQVV